MQARGSYKLVLVTAPNSKTARALAHAALKSRLVACANLVPGIESQYWWRGRIERSREVLLLLKTVPQELSSLEDLILAAHPYDTPEFIVLNIEGGNRRYLAWLKGSCQGPWPAPRSRATKRAGG